MTTEGSLCRLRDRWTSTPIGRVLALVALSAAGVAGCSEALESDIDSHTQELMASSDSLLLPRSPTSSLTDAKFCFDPSIASISKFRTLVRAVQNAADQWEDATSRRLRFGTIEECGEGVPIWVEDLDNALGATRGLGRFAQSIRFDPAIINDFDAASWIAAHEIGHALGFEHEHLHENSSCNREAGGSSVGDIFWSYDKDSIMDYCAYKNRSWTADQLLSTADKYLIDRIYGASGKYVKSDRKHHLRSGHGSFLFGRESTIRGITTVGIGLSYPGSQFLVENYDNPGEQLTMDDRVALKETSTGKYLRVDGSANSKARVANYNLTLGSRMAWRIRGYKDTNTELSVNQAFGLSRTVTLPNYVSSCQRIVDGECKNQVYLTATKQPKSSTIIVGVREEASSPPPKDETYLWRALGPM